MPPFHSNHAYRKTTENFHQSEALIKDAVGEKVSDFHENSHFPNYEETIAQLVILSAAKNLAALIS